MKKRNWELDLAHESLSWHLMELFHNVYFHGKNDNKILIFSKNPPDT